MEKHELIRQVKPVFDGMVAVGISLADIRNFEIYSELQRMKNEGLKIEYAIHCLSSRFNCSKSKIYAIVKDMKTEMPAATAKI